MKQLSGPRIVSAFAATLMPVVLGAVPSQAADQANGERLARRWCASCHIVAPDQKGSTEAPPFSVIAKGANFDASKLSLFLLDPHPKMPDLGLTRSAAADLSAYIASLK